MADYIEREAAKLRIFEYGVRRRNNSSISSACENLERQMNSIPAADVRPVVLCRDCKHYEQLDLFRNSHAWSGMCHYWDSHATREDGFCFKAAKKEES